MTSHEHPMEERGVRKESETRSGSHTDPHYESVEVQGRSWLSWGAVIAGALVALVTMVVLNILGIAVGAIAMEAGAEGGFGVGAAIWWTIATLIALFVGGMTAGYFAGSPNRNQGLMHGLVTWSLFVVATMLTVTTAAGQMLGGIFGVIGQNLTGALMALQPAETVEATLLQAGVEPAQIAEFEATMAAAGEQATEVLAIGAGWAFIALLLGALVAALGGSFATIEPGEREEKRSTRMASRLRPRET